MGIKFSNNASANITQALTSTATSVSVTTGKGDLFPSLVEGDYFYATLAGNNGLEIVKVTSRINDTMTIVRAQDNTTALSFDIGDLFELRIVAADFDDTFSHVETTLEDTVSNVEATLEDTVNALNSSVDNKMSSYLPKTGGTMTGPVTFNVGTVIKRNNTNSHVYIYGGTDTTDGAYLTLCGKDHASYPGSFFLRAHNGDTVKYLRGCPDGTLEWGGNSILTSAGGTITGNLNIGDNGRISASSSTSTAELRAKNADGDLGACVVVKAHDASSGPGAVYLQTRKADGTGGPALWVYRDGTAKLNGNPILTSAGGTLNSGIVFRSGEASIGKSDDTASLRIDGGSAYNKGSFIAVHGKDSSWGGALELSAYDGTKQVKLIGRPDGTLEWGGNNVLTSAGGSVSQLTSTTSVPLKRNVDNSSINIYGGTSSDSGRLALYGSDGTYPYECRLTADSHSFRVLADGTLYMSGKKIRYVTDTWTSGVNWYRKYSDGWIEQGGCVETKTTSSGTLTFHVAFSNTNYTIIAQDTLRTDTENDTNGHADHAGLSTYTTTSVRYSKRADQRLDWYACGY